MLKKIEHMMQLQDEMNSVVHPDWKKQGFNWNRAAWIECAELMEHVGWKWWKKQERNIEQAKLELVDIWHFILSDCIGADIDSLSLSRALVSFKYKGDSEDMLGCVEDLVRYIRNGQRRMVLNQFALCCNALGLSFDALYELYVGKNVLNKFRQANGYKEGTYIKTWFGKEDNEYLYELLGLLDSDSENYQTGIYGCLANAYRAVLEND